MSVLSIPQSHNQNSSLLVQSVLKLLLDIPLSKILEQADFVTQMRTETYNLNVTGSSILMSSIGVWIGQKLGIFFKHLALVKRAFYI